LNSEEKQAIKWICEGYISFRRRTVNKYSDRGTRNKYMRRHCTGEHERPYRLPEKHETEVNRQTQEMLRDEIIRTSVNQ